MVFQDADEPTLLMHVFMLAGLHYPSEPIW